MSSIERRATWSCSGSDAGSDFSQPLLDTINTKSVNLIHLLSLLATLGENFITISPAREVLAYNAFINTIHSYLNHHWDLSNIELRLVSRVFSFKLNTAQQQPTKIPPSLLLTETRSFPGIMKGIIQFTICLFNSLTRCLTGTSGPKTQSLAFLQPIYLLLS